jgi:hypothetical protein
MHDWEHYIRGTSRAKRRVFGESRSGWDADAVYWVDRILPVPNVGSKLRERKQPSDQFR